MPRLSHGATTSLESVQAAMSAISALNLNLGSPVMLAAPRRLTAFDYMFQDLQGDENLLPAGAATIANLQLLGATMVDTTPANASNADIPAAYTYLGQFIDHDVTLETMSDLLGDLTDPAVLPKVSVLQRIKNQRTATLDLDSVYEPPAPFVGERMLLGPVSAEGHPVTADREMDLPRAARDSDPRFDRFALIGDARNDENLIVAQLHVAFLKAHNAIVARGHNGHNARRILRQLYQWIVVEDFLRRVAGSAIVDRVLAEGNRFFTPDDANFFLPLEFSVAAYRFGHSMVRAEYDFNRNFGANGVQGSGSLDFLFTFTALSGQLGFGAGADTLPENWVIEWQNFVNPTPNPVRRIDTHLVDPLFRLRNETCNPLAGLAAKLAARNLLRGYKLRMPTGQAVAGKMGVAPLAPDVLMTLILANADRAGLSAADQDALRLSGFDTHTPLWFYILAESEIAEDGAHLGQVGGTIVAEVLIELVRRSADSIYASGNDWTPAQLGEELQMPISAEFTLRDLLELAGVL